MSTSIRHLGVHENGNPCSTQGEVYLSLASRYGCTFRKKRNLPSITSASPYTRKTSLPISRHICSLARVRSQEPDFGSSTVNELVIGSSNLRPNKRIDLLCLKLNLSIGPSPKLNTLSELGSTSRASEYEEDQLFNFRAAFALNFD